MLSLFKFVLEWLSSSRWAWAAELSLLLILGFTTLLIIARVIYTKPVQRLWKDIKRILNIGLSKVREANSSPYDKSFEDSRFLSWVMVIWFYTMAIFVVVYSIPFFLFFSGYFGTTDVPIYNRILSLGIMLALWFFARLLKVQGDKLLHKLRGGK